MNCHGDEDGTEATAGTGVEVNQGAQDENEDGSGGESGTGSGAGWRHVGEHRMETGTGTVTEARTIAEMVTGTRITGTRIGSGRTERRRRSAKKRKIVVDAMRETGETYKKCRTERVGPVAANPDNPESNNEAGTGVQ